MANVYKRLGAVAVSANTDTELYETPAATSAVVSTISVCNRGSSQATFRIAHVDATAVGSVANEDYIYYDVPIPANDTFLITAGVTMAAENIILVRSSSAYVNFISWGSEIS